MRKDKAHISKLSVFLKWSPTKKVSVGTLFHTKKGEIFFEYTSTFLASNTPISPFKLLFTAGAQIANTAEYPFHSLFGVFADSLPDGWGLLLMSRAMQKLGFYFDGTSGLDKLAFVGSRGLGSLIYEPSLNTKDEADFFVDLSTISDESNKIIEGSSDDVLNELLILGGSPGGARPKIVAAIESGKIEKECFKGKIISGHHDQIPQGYEPWIIKFHAKEDDEEMTLTEYLYCSIAHEIGIDIQPIALFPDTKKRQWFGMRRFDRLPDNKRLHMHSLAGLLHANYRIPSLDYEDILKATYVLTRSASEVEKMFRLAVFNAIFHNRDDHAKNISFLMEENGTWKLAPAYDLTWSEGPGGEHTTTYKGEGKDPGFEHFVALAKGVGINEKKVKEIIEQTANGKKILLQRAREMKLKKLLKRLGK